MSFLNPQALYFLLPLLFIFFWFLLTKKEAQGHFFSDEVMNRLRVGTNTLTIKTRNVLFFFIGILIVIALGNPVIKDGTITVKAKSADVMIALDISDSMLAEDVYPNRLKLAKNKAMELLKTAPDERIGVIAFAKNSYLVSPMSFDHSAVGFLLRQLNTNFITEKGTDFLSLLDVVDKSIKKESKKYLLILSDGGDSNDFSKEIAYAKEKNIVVFILGIGTKKGAPIKKEDGTFIKFNGEIIVSKLNENISELATSTGGVYIQSVKSNADIKAMIREIESKSEQKELKSEEVQKFIPLFYYPVGLALILLLIATSSMAKREKMQIPSVFILFVALLSINPHAKAGLLDFMELKEAKEAYENGDYEKSAKLYSKYAQSSKKGESYFNEGNSLYKQGKFDKAIESYQKATFNDDISKANKFANIGNSFVKQGKLEGLQKAVEFYEKSLKLNEDKEVRENLEAVKKEIEKQKKEKQKKQEKDKKKDDNKQDKDKNKKDKDKKSDDKKDESKDGDDSDKDSKDKEKSKDKDNSSKSKKSKDDKQKDSDDMKSKKEQDNSKGEENNETKPQKKKDDLEKLKKEDENQTKDSSQTPHAMNGDKMSDAEEEKWLKQLNMNKNTFMYKLNNAKQQERKANEKPW